MDLQPTIDSFYRAIMDKDAACIQGFYWPSAETYVVLEGPRLTTRGYELIAKGWSDFCASGLDLEAIDWREGPFTSVSESMAWLAGIIELRVRVRERAFSRIFRASFVLRYSAEAGRWLIEHEHVSAALDDPYGIGDWLTPPQS